MDVTQHPWRSGDLFDAIITDPPCVLYDLWLLSHSCLLSLIDGVRAGAKRLGRKKAREIVTERVQTFMAARGFCVSASPYVLLVSDL